ncbi:MAG: hypothetical protein IJ501_06560 [Bacilli bacterium]|nr:hypothetical protein [Bacilli bacterium]
MGKEISITTNLFINKDEIVNEIITLETLKNNLVKKLNENIGYLDSYKSEIELLKIILENQLLNEKEKEPARCTADYKYSLD